jgi:hypothetical protein
MGYKAIPMLMVGDMYASHAKVGFKDKEHRYRDMRYKF